MYSLDLLLLLAFAICNGQDTIQWTTIGNQRKNFSFDLPVGYLVNKEDNKTTVYGYGGDAQFTIIAEHLKRPKNDVKERYCKKKGYISLEKSEIGDFLVWKEESAALGLYDTTIYIGSSDDYFELIALSNSKNNEAVTRFLNSIQFDGKTLTGAAPSKDPKTEASVTFDQLLTSDEVAKALGQPDIKSPRGRLASVKEKNFIDFIGLSWPLIILKKPRPGYTDDARRKDIQGTIKARVEFLGDGYIGQITVDPSLDRGLAAQVGMAIGRIKFIPAKINGKPTNVTRIIEYEFIIYRDPR